MSSGISATFKRAAAAGFGWARGHKIQTLACLWLGWLGAYEAAGYIGNRLSEGPGRDQQMTVLLADIDRFAPPVRQFIAVKELMELAKTHPDKLQTPIDLEQLEKDRDALIPKYEEAKNSLTADFFRSRDISLKDMDHVRELLKTKVDWDLEDFGLDIRPTSKQLRNCENYFAAQPHERLPPTPTDLDHCAYDEQFDASVGHFMTGLLLILMVSGAGALGKHCYDEVEREKQRLAEAQAAGQAAAPPSVALGAPTKVSAPLKLKPKVQAGAVP